MRILIVRHGDPDYSVDSLTPQGRIEAELLSRKLCKMDITAFYTSPLGRARHTAEYTLEKMNRTAKVCEWLKEFPPIIDRPDRKGSISWDWYPQDWTKEDCFYSLEDWGKHPVMQAGKVQEEYERVGAELDKLLAEHGYVRQGRLYRAERANEDTLVFFCHFGLECVLLSHLLGISPMLLWHGFCAAPTSVTTLVTEERQKGFAYFRTSSFGDISHLYAEGKEPSFAARFCETYDNFEQRHD
ncbi:MAG: histidine phosphatase family protein [Clostridia bacterium]|nr:histidine phosphatase family protein [Clostridia bacterium]